MKLSFVRRHLSIKDFPTTCIPNFTLLTGTNGAGKTHLLQAIHQGAIEAEGEEISKDEIRLFDWNSLIPKDTGEFKSETITNEYNDTYIRINNIVNRRNNEIDNINKMLGNKFDQTTAYQKIISLSEEEIINIAEDEGSANEIKKRIRNLENALNQEIFQDDNLRSKERGIRTVADDVQKPVSALTQDDFINSSLMAWGQTDGFQQSLARLFVAYRDIRQTNDLQILAKQRGDSEASPLNEDEFIKKYMIAPWGFVNDAFKEANLDFEIDHPHLYTKAPYHPHLKKLSTEDTVLFGNLSSGEKIIMSLALALYYAQDKRQITTYPKILLLDEIDATLHPSMAKTLLSIIMNTIVKKHGIHVIATTHSPSTIALAPEDAIYVMESGVNGIRKTTKAQALNILTRDVPTIAISFDGRRQVFVESPNDAAVYDAAYQALKHNLRSQRSLQFIATGGKRTESASHSGTGCDAVKRLVKTLADSGNITVFGLIDWDGSNVSEGRVKVLAEDKRNGLENLIFDPLLMCALLAFDFISESSRIGFKKEDTYSKFRDSTPERLQLHIDAIQKLILGEDVLESEAVDVEYEGGFSLSVAKKYLTMDDHELETKILAAFPFLKSITRAGAGSLMEYVATRVIRDCPHFAPKDLSATFSELLDAEVS